MDTRTKDGIEEHRHREYDFWHPSTRGHKMSGVHGFDVSQTSWTVSDDEINEIVDALHKSFNTTWRKYTVGTPEWIAAVAVGEIQVDTTYRSGKVSSMRISSYRSGVSITSDHTARYDRNCPLHDAKQLLESGLAGMYHDNPSLIDAAHVLHVSTSPSDGDRHYDLIRLPNGMHVPVDVLEAEYGVSWETIARIPLGEPRDDCTFSCPMCGDRSYYAGVCERCRDVAECAADMQYTLDLKYEEEIRRVTQSYDWMIHCQYIRGI